MSSETFETGTDLDNDEITSSLFKLFAPPTSSTTTTTQSEETLTEQSRVSQTAPSASDGEEDLRRTFVASNRGKRDATALHDNFSDEAAFSSLFEPSPPTNAYETTPLLSSSFGNDTVTPKVGVGQRKSSLTTGSEAFSVGLTPARPTNAEPIFQSMYSKPLPPIEEAVDKTQSFTRVLPSMHFLRSESRKILRVVLSEMANPSTWVGAFMCLLFHIVYCLTMGSAIAGTQASMLGLFTKQAALGIFVGGPVFWAGLKGSSEIPAMYPTVDLFTAPFLASIAILVKNTIQNDSTLGQDIDQVFLASFTFLACVAIVLAGIALAFSGVFRLGNLGSFLPYPVIAGFFAAVGVLTWSLAFKIDTQMGLGQVFFSGDVTIIRRALLHHSPSFVLGSLMKFLGPFNPFYVISVVIAGIALFYIVLLLLGMSMAEAVEEKWFWNQSNLVYEDMNAKIGFSQWAPPAPFGLLNSLYQGKVHWGAVAAGMEPTLALAFLYILRCSIHCAALKKNVTSLKRTETVESASSPILSRKSIVSANQHARKFSEVLDLEQVAVNAGDDDGAVSTDIQVVSPKPTSLGLKDMLVQYGNSQVVCSLVGSFAVVPSVAISPTMYLLRAEKLAPQIGASILLFFFYLTDFKVVGFIPKPAVSSLLVLAFLDMMHSWMIRSYFRIKEKAEWFVIPLIVVSATFVGLLPSIFVGLALSTMIFIANFFRSGTVKYLSNGCSVRSTIERPLNAVEWLNSNGELIQVLVLQNYLFFGNAASIQTYITSMFEETDPNLDPVFVPPIPKVVILDLSLVTGMDTSSVDVFQDIAVLCSNNDCRLFMSGMNSSLLKIMSLSGFKPDTAKNRSSRRLRFFSDMDKAVGKAEDMLLQNEGFENHINHGLRAGIRGFEHALNLIDKQHSINVTSELKELGNYTEKIVLEPGDVLYEDVQTERGLFFIEHGIVKVERDSAATLTRSGDTVSRTLKNSWGSLSQVKPMDISQAIAKMRSKGHLGEQKTFRVARLGPGWVIGTGEAISQAVNPGMYIAVTKCELHFLSFDKIKELEQENTMLVLALYKLLASLMAKRQSQTIDQMATLHAIMMSTGLQHYQGRHSLSEHLAAGSKNDYK